MHTLHPNCGPVNAGCQAAAWAARAEELAAWAMARLVVRTDCWGSNTPPDRRGRLYTRADGTTAKVPASYTAKGQLTLARLARHFHGAGPEDVVGLHSTSTANTCLAARVDIDRHGPGGNDPVANLKAAISWYDRLTALGFRALLYGSNGGGGFHLSALFSEPVPARLTFSFLRWLTADHARNGLAVRPEHFPKQAAIPEGGFGNWLRIVGRHHTQPYWPQVWDGCRWLTGVEAVRLVLSLTGDSPALIPGEALTEPARNRPAFPRPARGATVAVPGRIAAYMARLPNLGEGQGRDDVAYQFAAWLVRDLALADDVALGWLEAWDQGNTPPKGRARLEEILGSAHKYGTHAVGCGLGVAPARRPRRGAPQVRFTVEV